MNTPRNGGSNGKEKEEPYVVNVHLTEPLLNEKGDAVWTLAWPHATMKQAMAFAGRAATQPVVMQITPEIALIIPLHRIDHIVVRPLVIVEAEEVKEEVKEESPLARIGPRPGPTPKIQVVRN